MVPLVVCWVVEIYVDQFLGAGHGFRSLVPYNFVELTTVNSDSTIINFYLY